MVINKEIKKVCVYVTELYIYCQLSDIYDNYTELKDDIKHYYNELIKGNDIDIIAINTLKDYDNKKFLEYEYYLLNYYYNNLPKSKRTGGNKRERINISIHNIFIKLNYKNVIDEFIKEAEENEDGMFRVLNEN